MGVNGAIVNNQKWINIVQIWKSSQNIYTTYLILVGKLDWYMIFKF